MHACDGFVTNWCTPYDGKECLHAFAKCINSTRPRPVFHLGPLLPLEPGSSNFCPECLDAELATLSNDSSNDTTQFLDDVCSAFGPRSMMYISFGSEHWWVHHMT